MSKLRLIERGKKAFNVCSEHNLTLMRERSTATMAEDITTSENVRPFEEIPGYRKLPFIGTSWVNLPFVGKYKPHSLGQADKDKYQLFGDINRDQFGDISIVNCYDPKDTEAIFRNEGKYPDRGFLNSLKAYRESRKQWYNTIGIIMLQGKEWHDLRFKLQKTMLKPKAIEQYVAPMDQVALDLVEKLYSMRDSKNEIPDTLGELYKWALESVAYFGLDTRLGCLNQNLAPDSEAMRFIQEVQTGFECMNNLESFNGNIQIWKYFPTPTWRKFVKAMDFFSETAVKYIAKAMEDLKTKNETDKEMTMLQSFLKTKDLDLSGTVTMVMDMLMAGVDTTSHTVGFILYRLAKNPDKQQKLYEEIIRELPSPNDRITPEVLRKLVYIKYCIKESTRLDPIVRGFARKIGRDTVLSGYKVPAGTTCFALTQVTCQQEKYFSAADKFIPERWLDEKNKPNPFLFLPFGFGIRSCIGRRLAELEIMCAVIEILRRFKLQYHYEDIGMLNRLVNFPDKPLKFTFIERTN